jgi:hypothetical protein
MTRQPVISSNLVSVGYEATSQILEIEFRGDSVYQYSSVPEAVYHSLMSAASKGSYHNTHIKDRYSFVKVR